MRALWGRFKGWAWWQQLGASVLVALVIGGLAPKSDEQTEREVAIAGVADPDDSSATETTLRPTSTTEAGEVVTPAPVPEETAANAGVASATAGQSLLDQLTVAAEGSGAGYSRSLFPHWSDLDGNGCDAREDTLKAEEVNGRAQVDPYGCKVVAGDWFSIYDGVTVTDPSELDVDHVVALAEAWRSGASGWDEATREAFANDLDYPHALVAVTASSNRSKSDNDPASWRPARAEAHCWFATAWTTTKLRWSLTADRAEVDALAQLFKACDNAASATTAPPATTSPPATSPPPPPPPPTQPPQTTAAAPPPPSGGCPNAHNYTTADGSCIDDHDKDGNGDVNCSEVPASAKPVRVHGEDPHRLDGDGDGWGCEG